MRTDNVLEIENLSIAFGGLRAVDSLSFQIGRNEIFGLIGPNGAGKTTVFNCITQFYKADEGSIRYRSQGGEDVELMTFPVHEVIKKGVVRTFQNVELIKELSILENVLIGAHHELKSGLVDQVFNRKKVKEEEARYRKEAVEVLQFLGIDHLKDAIAGAMPYGVQKKVEIARSLMADPELLILDEPAAGLNDQETQELADRIRQIRDHYQCTILLVEHDMRLVMGICDRICAISFGKRIACGTPKEIQEDKEVQKAYLGEEGKLG